MKTRRFTDYCHLFFKTAALVFFGTLPLRLSPACIPSDRYFHGYTFINMDILQPEDKGTLASVFMRFDQLYKDYFETVEKENQKDNLSEWYERYCGQIKREDLAYIIYKAPIGELELLLTATRSKSLQIPPNLQDNTLAHFIFKKKCTENLEYFIYTKQCEPHVTATEQWQAPPRNKENMQRLIAEGKRQFSKTNSHYIRLRYAYQIIRLAHYAGEYEQTLALYDELIPKVDKQDSRWEESIIPWWIMGHRAGALRQLGDNVQASYLYSLVFQHCPGRRASAFQSFYIKTDEEWQDCLRLCHSDEERATLYAIRASGKRSKALSDMERIYELSPQNRHLEVLLVQEIRKMERNLLGLEFNSRKEENKKYYQLPAPGTGKYVIDLQKFARKARQEGKVERPELWRLAEGYLEFLAGDFYAAQRTFVESGEELKDKTLRDQLQAFQLALKIASFEKPSPEVDSLAFDLIRNSNLYRSYQSFPDFLKDKMAWLYNNYDQKGKAFLSQRPLSDLRPNPQIDLLEDLIATALKPNQTRFERLLMENNPLEALLDIKATLLMSRGEIEAAFETYRRMPVGSWDDFGQFNPFRETFKDCISCYQRATDTLSLSDFLNKGELLQKLLDLEYKAKAGLEGAPLNYYRLGLAYYNMSYFGYSWKAMDFFRSGSTWTQLHQSKLAEGDSRVYDYRKFPYGNRENTGLSKALYFFEKSRLLAATPELAARAAFQAARCEQKIFFQSPEYKPEPCCNQIPRLPEEYLVNFSRLKLQYQDTEFYRQIIKECKYFAVYAQK